MDGWMEGWMNDGRTEGGKEREGKASNGKSIAYTENIVLLALSLKLN